MACSTHQVRATSHDEPKARATDRRNTLRQRAVLSQEDESQHVSDYLSAGKGFVRLSLCLLNIRRLHDHLLYKIYRRYDVTTCRREKGLSDSLSPGNTETPRPLLVQETIPNTSGTATALTHTTLREYVTWYATIECTCDLCILTATSDTCHTFTNIIAVV